MLLGHIAKKWLRTILVFVFKRLPPEVTVPVIRDGVLMSDIYHRLPHHLLVDLSMGGMSKLPRIKSLIVEGDLGVYEAMTSDRTILPSYVKTGTWSPSLQALIADNVFKDGKGTYIDIGANIGLTCIPIAMRHRVNCIAFEPDPTNYKLLQENIIRNNVSQFIEAHNIALFDSDGELTMELSEDNHGDHRLRLGHHVADNDAFAESYRQTIKVTTRRLDEVIGASKLHSPVLAKIDVQGAELHVMKGGRRLLNNIDVIAIEFWPYGLRRAGSSFVELFDYFSEFPFGAILCFDRAPSNQTDSHLELQDIRTILSELNASTTPSDPEFHVDIILSRESGKSLLVNFGRN